MSEPQRYRRAWLPYVKVTLLIFVIAFLGIGGLMVYVGISTSLQAEENLHATLFMTRLVEQFVHDKGRWPSSWDELEGFQFPSVTPSPLNGKMSAVYIGGQHGYEWPSQVKHLKECVAINFQIDPKVVAYQDAGTFTAITPIGAYYEYRDYGFVQSLQETLRTAVKAKVQENHVR